MGNARERFSEDALRILRGVRFAAQLGFEIDEETKEGMKLLAPTLENISAERIQAVSYTHLSDIPNKLKPAIYSFGLVAVGEKSVIPDGVQIGKNTAISGVTSKEDYPNGVLESGETLIKAGERA